MEQGSPRGGWLWGEVSGWYNRAPEEQLALGWSIRAGYNRAPQMRLALGWGVKN